MANKRSGKYGTYYGSYFNESVTLTTSELNTNAKYIYLYLSAEGWSLNAIAGILGNMQHESALNPGRWQSNDVNNLSGGYGLTQWTPASKYINWCSENGYSDPSEMDNNLKRIIYELENGGQYYATDEYNYSFKTFSTSNKTPYELACAFAWNYERSWVVLYGSEAEKQALRELRGGSANSWYEYLSELEPATKFTPRLDSTGIEGSFYYYSQNPFYLSGYGLPNCTCYAWGRFWEISDSAGDGSNKPTLPTGNAGEWYPNVTGYEKGSEAKLGAVICWDKPGEAGHVAIVEKIYSNGDILTSNSAWQSTFFYTKTLYKADNYNFGSYVFQGFIYNPYVSEGGSEEPEPPPEPPYIPPKRKRKKYNFLLFNRNRRIKNG